MATTYTPTPTLVTSITIPADGDNASAASVNVSSMALTNMTAYLFQQYGRIMQSTSPIRIQDNGDNFNMTVRPLSLAIVTEAGVWKSIFTSTDTVIGIANLEGGGTYALNSYYYIYVYSAAGVASFQISVTPPDQFNLYKSGSFTYKYLASFVTDSSGHIIPFSKYGSFTQYTATPALSGGGGASNIEAPTGVQSFIPIRETTLTTMNVQVSSASATPNILHLISISGHSGQEYAVPANTTFTLQAQVMTDNTAQVYWKTSTPDPSIQFIFSLAGYSE